jgi:hypothetical protein
VGLSSWLQCFPVPCPQHKFWALAPTIGVAVYVAWWATGRRTLATAVIVGAFMLPTARFQLESARAKLTTPRLAIQGVAALAGMWAIPVQAGEWRRLGDAVSQEVSRRPDVPMLLAGEDGLFGALVTNTENPGPFFVDWKIPGQDLRPLRARFVRTARPLVLLEHGDASGLEQVLSDGGYSPVYTGRWGTLLAPGAAPRTSGVDEHADVRF